MSQGTSAKIYALYKTDQHVACSRVFLYAVAEFSLADMVSEAYLLSVK